MTIVIYSNEEIEVMKEKSLKILNKLKNKNLPRELPTDLPYDVRFIFIFIFKTIKLL